eukprot:385088-Amphidinium_carterae.1
MPRQGHLGITCSISVCMFSKPSTLVVCACLPSGSANILSSAEMSTRSALDSAVVGLQDRQCFQKPAFDAVFATVALPPGARNIALCTAHMSRLYEAGQEKAGAAQSSVRAQLPKPAEGGDTSSPIRAAA